jgi:hypothetical protein
VQKENKEGEDGLMIDDRLSWEHFVVMTYEYMTTAGPVGFPGANTEAGNV